MKNTLLLLICLLPILGFSQKRKTDKHWEIGLNSTQLLRNLFAQNPTGLIGDYTFFIKKGANNNFFRAHFGGHLVNKEESFSGLGQFLTSKSTDLRIGLGFERSLNLPDVPFAYSSEINIGTATAPIIISNVNDENPDVTPDGATLGRVLFYDQALSLNNRVACASCHFQENAFADGKAHSVGFEGKITPRNSMAINNPVLNRSLFWDSRATSATNLALQPAQNHIEMGMEDLDYLAEKLKKIEYYPDLFEKAFGANSFNKENISNALAQFLCSMTTMNSKFDRVNKGEEEFSTMEQLGSNIFNGRGKCNECHAGANFMADDSPHGAYGGTTSSGESIAGTANVGLDKFTKDAGRNNGSFRIPSLRNIGVTGPYMHDGRFEKLEDVIDFYSHSIQDHEDLDPKLKDNGLPIRFNFTELEKQALVAFLQTLTDQEYLTAEKYSSPFK